MRPPRQPIARPKKGVRWFIYAGIVLAFSVFGPIGFALSIIACAIDNVNNKAWLK